MHPFLRRLLMIGLLLLAASMVLVVFAVAAGALETGGPEVTEPAVKDLFDSAQLLAWIGGVVIPFAVALLAKARAALWVKSLLATACAGLIALGAYLADVSGGHTWRGGVSVFVISVVAAAASRYTITGGADTYVNAQTANFGFG